jgi:hypothetical protein
MLKNNPDENSLSIFKETQKKTLSVFSSIASSHTKNPFGKAEDVCFPETDTDQNCKASYLSICSTGDFFGNKVTTYDEKADKNINIILQQRKVAAAQVQVLGNKVLGRLYENRTTLFKTMSNEVFSLWVNYLKLLIDAPVRIQSHNAGKGACGEAAKASVANSLFKQTCDSWANFNDEPGKNGLIT